MDHDPDKVLEGWEGVVLRCKAGRRSSDGDRHGHLPVSRPRLPEGSERFQLTNRCGDLSKSGMTES